MEYRKDRYWAPNYFLYICDICNVSNILKLFGFANDIKQLFGVAMTELLKKQTVVWQKEMTNIYTKPDKVEVDN